MRVPIEVDHLSVVFPAHGKAIKALDDLNLRVNKGQVVGFLGPNGAGKTTTMHVLLGFIAPTSGEARIFGEDVSQSIARKRIGYLPEHPDTYRFMTGRELLTMAGKLFLMKGSLLKNRIEEVLKMTGISHAADRRISTYSRGMLQRIGLAQALINDPDLVILDEPTSGLDPIGRTEIRRVISTLRDRKKTVFFSSHELSEVELVCDHIIILSGGHVLAEGTATDLVQPGESLERYFMNVLSDTNHDIPTETGQEGS